MSGKVQQREPDVTLCQHMWPLWRISGQGLLAFGGGVERGAAAGHFGRRAGDPTDEALALVKLYFAEAG